jgi:hypothetical protein
LSVSFDFCRRWIDGAIESIAGYQAIMANPTSPMTGAAIMRVST